MTPDALPKTMRAAVMYDVDDIRIEARPVPPLQPGDLLVRTAASGVCSGDLMPWYVRKKAPFVFGHEPAGTVVAIGAGGPAPARDGRPFALGDRVFAHHHAPCFACAECATGRYVHCRTWRATALDPGGMAEYFRVPRANLSDTLVLPQALSFADGSLVEPLACVVKSLRRALPRALGAGLAGTPGDALAGTSVYVIGAGVMGLMHVAVAAHFGAAVYASDFHAGRRAAAERLGAARVFPPDEAIAALRGSTGGHGARAVICGPGTPEALAHAVDATAADGTVLMFTPISPDERMIFDQSAAYFRDIRLVASYSCGPNDTAEAMRLIATGVVTAERLGAVEVPFPDVAVAYERMQSAGVVKAIVTYG
ncbi:MAG: zinc-dependent dehydrogenase [Vulcanimicrobiaceae bacterium]